MNQRQKKYIQQHDMILMAQKFGHPNIAQQFNSARQSAKALMTSEELQEVDEYLRR